MEKLHRDVYTVRVDDLKELTTKTKYFREYDEANEYFEKEEKSMSKRGLFFIKLFNSTNTFRYSGDSQDNLDNEMLFEEY